MKFWVELHSDHPRVVFHLDNLHEVALRIDARHDEPGVFEPFAVRIVKFKTVAVAFAHRFLPVGLARARALYKGAFVGAKAHCRTLVNYVLLVVH